MAERIWELADEMGYVPKERKKRESSKKKIKNTRSRVRASFMLEINRGIRRAALELADPGSPADPERRDLCRRRRTAKRSTGTDRRRNTGGWLSCL